MGIEAAFDRPARPPHPYNGIVTSTIPSGCRAAAFFDLDKTVIARSSTLAFLKPLRGAGLVKRRTMVRAAAAQVIYRVGGADQRQLDRVRDQLISLTKGWKADRIRRLVQEAVDEVASFLVYREALALIEQHRRQGREIVILSASPEEVVESLTRYLGVDHVVATRSEVDEEGRYTGLLSFYATGDGKAEAIDGLARRWNLDLHQCYAYSDSSGDLPMLEMVGHPVTVNPDRHLKQTAAARGWPVVHFDSPVTLRSSAEPPAWQDPALSGVALATVMAGAITLWVLLARRRAA